MELPGVRSGGGRVRRRGASIFKSDGREYDKSLVGNLLVLASEGLPNCHNCAQIHNLPANFFEVGPSSHVRRAADAGSKKETKGNEHYKRGIIYFA